MVERLCCTLQGLVQFTYINLAFSPAPDDTIANLYRVSPSPILTPFGDQQTQKSFATDGHLIVNYR
jgi:ubiquitin-like protein ATG12